MGMLVLYWVHAMGLGVHLTFDEWWLAEPRGWSEYGVFATCP